jgi:glycosyltransferase involved in cell wall biosynthesis
MEAMASGAEIVTTRMGALPETAHGFGRLLSLEGDRIDFAAQFAAAVAESLAAMKADPAAARRRRDEQLAFARSEYTWQRRARQWLDWLGAANW